MPSAGLIRSGAVAVLATIAIAVLIAGCGDESLVGSGSDEAPSGPGDVGAARADADSYEYPSESDIGEPSAEVVGASGDGGGLPLPQFVDR